MKINSISESRPSSSINRKTTNPICFSGLKNPTTKCMFVFDLDGTFAHGTKEELSKIVEIAKQRVANLVYATGRNKEEVEKLQQKLADKADGVAYLRKQLNVPYNEILMAGNDDNDVSMAKLSKKGAYFICLNNASDKLKRISLSLKNAVSGLLMVKSDGAKGILEGISETIS